MGNFCAGSPEHLKKHVHVLEELHETGLKFHDAEFPAGPESLMVEWEDENYN